MKKFVSIFLLIVFLSSSVFANEIGNTISTEEYPDSNMVLPNKQDDFVIEGGVAKYIDVNLEDCLKFALGNNPLIQAAIQDVLCVIVARIRSHAQEIIMKGSDIAVYGDVIVIKHDEDV